MNTDWGRIKDAASYARVCPRTIRKWLKDGLKHSRLPTGTVFIRFNEVDNFLSSFTRTDVVDKNMATPDCGQEGGDTRGK